MAEFRTKAHQFEVQEKIVGSRRICYDLKKLIACFGQTQAHTSGRSSSPETASCSVT